MITSHLMTSVARYSRNGGLSVICALSIMLISSCSERPQLHSHSASIMGTSWSIKVVEPMDEDQFATLIKDLSHRLTTLEAMMSTYQNASQISRFNASRSTDWQSVSQEVVAVVAYAQKVSRLTDGAFDITVAPIVELWGFGKTTIERKPTDQEIKDVSASIGHHHLSFRQDPPALRKNIAELRVDLSAIAKGYAVDELAKILHLAQMKNYLLEVGGELRASGKNHNFEIWKIGVEKPVPGWREVMRAVQLDGSGIATSGDYRNFVEFNDKRYSHEIDPRALHPILYQGGSVTVIAKSTMQADAWATGLFIIGKEKGMQIAKQQGLAVYYIEQTADGFVQTMNKQFSKHMAQPQ